MLRSEGDIERNALRPAGNLATSTAEGQSVRVDSYAWFVGTWGFGNCDNPTRIASAPPDIEIFMREGSPPIRQRVESADETMIVTKSYRFVRDAEGVQWIDRGIDQMTVRLVPCPLGATPPTPTS